MSFNGTIEVSCSDLDYYQRKIIRLQDDITILHDQLSKVRGKLRIAEDYEIKYNILLKTTQEEIEQLRQQLQEAKKTPRAQIYQEQQQKLREEEESKWNRKQYQLQQKFKNQADRELQMLRSERDQYQRKIHELTVKRQDGQMVAIKIKKLEKENEALQQQIQDNRVHFDRKKMEEISDLKTKFNQSYKQKMTKERKIYEKKINELENKLLEQEISKDHEIFKIPTSNNNELASLKQLYTEVSKSHSKQKAQLEYLLAEKGKQNKKLTQERHILEKKYQDDISKLEAQISRLEESLLDKQKQYEIELTQHLNHSNQLQQKQLSERDQYIKELQLEATNQKKWWSTKIMNHDKQIQLLTQKQAQQINCLNDTINDLKGKVNELSSRLHSYEGQRAAGETQGLIDSLKDMEQREKHMTNYQDGITFLEQQLTRAQHKLEQKTRAVQAAHDEVASIRAEVAQDASYELEKMIKLKQEHNYKLTILQKEITSLYALICQKEKDIKKVERQKVVQQSEFNIQINKLKFELDQLRKDYRRIIQSKKQTDTNYRAQRQKNVGNGSDVSGVHKQKWLGLEKQKTQLEAIYREKQQQIKLKYEGQLHHKNSELTQIKHLQNISSKQNELLQQQNRKLREELDCNRQNTNTKNYQYKLATVNLELALTQNIYDKLIEAKCRAEENQHTQENIDGQEESYRMITQPLQREGPTDQILIHDQSQQPLLFSAGPSTTRKPE